MHHLPTRPNGVKMKLHINVTKATFLKKKSLLQPNDHSNCCWRFGRRRHNLEDLPLLRVDELDQSLLLLPLGFDLRAPLGSQTIELGLVGSRREDAGHEALGQRARRLVAAAGGVCRCIIEVLEQ